MPQLIEVTHVSKRGVSFRITLPKKAAEALKANSGDIIGFYLEEGKVFVKKMD
jgi:bifunctional DNA-binding transcriptional regulator/antitoxin component of YhaV-PrlF toxin-antitoxin module